MSRLLGSAQSWLTITGHWYGASQDESILGLFWKDVRKQSLVDLLTFSAGTNPQIHFNQIKTKYSRFLMFSAQPRHWVTCESHSFLGLGDIWVAWGWPRDGPMCQHESTGICWSAQQEASLLSRSVKSKEDVCFREETSLNFALAETEAKLTQKQHLWQASLKRRSSFCRSQSLQAAIRSELCFNRSWTKTCQWCTIARLH